MRGRTVSFLLNLCCVCVCLWAVGCGGGGSLSPPPPSSPTITSVTVSPSTASLQVGQSQQFTATVQGTGSFNSSVNWLVNDVQGGNVTVGTISATGLYTAPGSVPNPNTVTVKATSVADATKSGSASATITAPLIQVSISPISASVTTAGTQQYTATVTGTANQAVTWSVNDSVGGNNFVGLITIAGVYTAPSVVPLSNTVTVKATSAADSSKFASGTVTITQGPQLPAKITSLSTSSATSSAEPFSRLVITGSGFDPVTSAISVSIIPGVSSIPITVPVYAATTTTLEIIVPPLVDLHTGGFTSGAVDVQVVQLTPSSLVTSDVFSGLSILALPSVDPTVPPGAVTRAYLKSGLIVLSGVQSTPGLSPDLVSALSAVGSDQTALEAQVASVVSNPALTLSLKTKDGNPFILDSTTLRVADQLIVAYLQKLVPMLESQTQTSSGLSFSSGLSLGAQANPSCINDTQNAFIDDFICRRQTYEQTLATQSVQAWQFGAKLEGGYYLGFLGGQIAAALSEAGVIASGTAKALQLQWTATTPYLMSYATLTSKPPISEPLLKVGAKLLDTAAFKGIPVTQSALTAHIAYSKAEAITTTPGPSPQGGIEVSSSTTNVPTGSQSVVGFQGTGTYATATDLTVPGTQTTTPIAAATTPPPDVRQFDGFYLGSYNGSEIDASGVTSPVSGPVAFSVSNGIITVTSPGPGAGILSFTGLVLIGSVSTADADCSFGGRFDIAPQSLQGLAGGGFSCTVLGGGTSSGNWSAVR